MVTNENTHASQKRDLPSLRDLVDTDAGTLSAEEQAVYYADQWTLMGRRFKKHKLAVYSMWVVVALYLVAIFCEFVAPYQLSHRHNDRIYAPPQALHFFHKGRWRGPFVYGYKMEIDRENFKRVYAVDRENIIPIKFLVRGDPYEWWGLWETDLHLFGPGEGKNAFLLGTDRLGRDTLSRVIYGSRISLSVGLIGLTLSFVLGLTIGGISGYMGGAVDEVIQRIVEVLRSFPSLPLWMALAAAMPPRWPPVRVYFGITVVLSLIGWTGLSRAVRGKLLALREEDYVMAARIAGAGRSHIIARHLLPGFMSYIIVSLTLAIPGMILGETSLSYLGLGLRPPVTSWGVLLAEAQNANIVALYPWLLIPGIPVVVAVLAFNFMGDGLRDAADPYSR
jgi:peptide/nickel transport system permease protein